MKLWLAINRSTRQNRRWEIGHILVIWPWLKVRLKPFRWLTTHDSHVILGVPITLYLTTTPQNKQQMSDLFHMIVSVIISTRDRTWGLTLRILLVFSEIHGFLGKLVSSRNFDTHPKLNLRHESRFRHDDTNGLPVGSRNSHAYFAQQIWDVIVASS